MDVTGGFPETLSHCTGAGQKRRGRGTSGTGLGGAEKQSSRAAEQAPVVSLAVLSHLCYEDQVALSGLEMLRPASAHTFVFRSHIADLEKGMW